MGARAETAMSSLRSFYRHLHEPRSGGVRPLAVTLGEILVDQIDGLSRAGGAPFNVARHVGALGMEAAVIGRIGSRDPDANAIIRSLRHFGVREDGLQRDAELPTGRADVAGPPGEERYRIASPAAWDALELVQARAALARLRPHILYFGTLAMRTPTARQTVLTLLDETPATRLLDLNLRPGQDNRPLAREALARAEWLKVNADELTQLLLWFVPRTDALAERGSRELRRGVAELARQFAIDRIVVTYGADGYDAYGAQGRLDLPGIAPPPVVVADAVGAGDAFCGAWIAMALAGMPLSRLLPLANRYAAASCAEPGPVPDDDEFFGAWRWVMGLPRPSKVA
jgi:fructokinase